MSRKDVLLRRTNIKKKNTHPKNWFKTVEIVLPNEPAAASGGAAVDGPEPGLKFEVRVKLVEV